MMIILFKVTICPRLSWTVLYFWDLLWKVPFSWICPFLSLTGNVWFIDNKTQLIATQLPECTKPFSTYTLLLGWWEGHPTCENPSLAISRSYLLGDMALPGVIFGKIGQLNKKLKLKVELYKAQKVLLNSPKMDNLLYLEALPQLLLEDLCLVSLHKSICCHRGWMKFMVSLIICCCIQLVTESLV